MKYLLFPLSCLLAISAIAQQTQPNNGVVLVVPDPDHPWAAAQLGAVLADEVAYHEGSLLQALTLARSGEAKGVIEIKLDTDAAFETGRVVCYAPNGKKLWEEKIFVNFGGGAEAIARKFADKLERKVQGKHCPLAAAEKRA